MPSTIPTKEHGGSTDPRVTLRKVEFRQLDRIQRKLERRHKTVEFSDDKLDEVSIVRGAPFDIDEDDPIDLDPRFFLPGPVENSEYGIEAVQRDKGLMRCVWPQAKPIENHRLREDDVEYKTASNRALHDARARGGFCEGAASKDSAWIPHGHIPPCKKPSCLEVRPSPQDGHPCWQYWLSGEYYMWPRAPGKGLHHPNVPHAVATVYDMARPKQQGLLRSELLVTVGLLKAQIRYIDMYLDHQVYPVLVVSFHGRFSARVIQAYFYNGRVVIRASRLVNLYTQAVSPEVRLLVRWLNSRPVGDTRLPVTSDEEFDDDASSAVEVTDAEKPFSQTVAVR